MQNFSPCYLDPSESQEGEDPNTTRLLADRLDCVSVQSEPARILAPAVTPQPPQLQPPQQLQPSQQLQPPQQPQQLQQQQASKFVQAQPPVDKRDSLSDSGAEGSGTNTPTRGRTITEGLLRFVQDSSLAKPLPERKIRQVKSCSIRVMASVGDPDPDP